MPILPYIEENYPNLKDYEDKVFAYVMTKNTELEIDVSRRLFGVKNTTSGYLRAGYKNLRNFYEGQQWFTSREDGAAMNVINFCRMTVNSMTAFMTQEPPEIDIPPQDAKDEIELARVKQVEGLINDIFDDNNWSNLFYEGVQNGSLLGETIIVGPFYDAKKKRIWFANVKRPEFIRVIWDSNEYRYPVGFIYQYWMAVEEAKTVFKDMIPENIDLAAVTTAAMSMGNTSTSANNPAMDLGQKKVIVRELWDDQIKLTALNDVVKKVEFHNSGFVPIQVIRNIPHPTEPWGISDIEDLLDPQRSYNEVNSDMQDILKQVAFASIFGKNIELEEIQAGVSKVYDMGEESEVFPDPRNSNFPFLQAYLGDKKNDVDVTSGIPNAFQGSKAVQNVSGRALSVIMTPINNAIRGKEHRWEVALKSLIKNIELLLEKHVPEAKQLIQGWYKADIFFPGTLIRDVTDELNKMIQKTQSQYTTMKNIGIASPKDEQELMKKELKDTPLMIELSRAPAIQLQVAMQAAMQKAQSAAEKNKAAGNRPTLTEGQNQPGDNPASAAGVPAGTTTTPAGAVAMAGSQGGAPAMLPGG